jgi:hypothetical protein
MPTAEAATRPIASDPSFQQDLEEAEGDFEADIPSYLRYYPVVSLTRSIRPGG